MIALYKINIYIQTGCLIVYKMYAHTCTWAVMFQVFVSCSTRNRNEHVSSKLTTQIQTNLIIINSKICLGVFFQRLNNSENIDVNVLLTVSVRKLIFFSPLSHFSELSVFLKLTPKKLCSIERTKTNRFFLSVD